MRSGRAVRLASASSIRPSGDSGYVLQLQICNYLHVFIANLSSSIVGVYDSSYNLLPITG